MWHVQEIGGGGKEEKHNLPFDNPQSHTIPQRLQPMEHGFPRLFLVQFSRLRARASSRRAPCAADAQRAARLGIGTTTLLTPPSASCPSHPCRRGMRRGS